MTLWAMTASCEASLDETPNIPIEITDQCQKGGSILIGGGPGSGKTILTLSLLYYLKKMNHNVTFISTRLPISTLLKTTALSRELGAESLVDSSMQKSYSDEPGIRRLPMADIHDLSILLLKEADDRSVIALDSWEALIQRERRPREEVYTSAMDVINRTPGVLILTTEDAQNLNPLEHIVDTHIRLELEKFGESRIRLLQMEKLRGRTIDIPTYVFSLHGGVFKAYDPRSWSFRERPIKATRMPVPGQENGASYSTGFPRLDKILGGGYKHGSCIGVEIDLEAPPELFDLTFLPTVLDFLVKQRPVLILPPGARDTQSLWDTLRAIASEQLWDQLKTKLIDSYVKVISYGVASKEDGMVNVGTDIEDDMMAWRKTRREMKYRFAQPLLCVMGYDTLVRIYGSHAVEPFMGRVVSETHQLGDLIVSIITSDLTTKRYMLGVSDYYFRLKLVKGIPVFWGVKPRTGPHVMSLINESGHPRLNLHKMS